MCAKNPKTTPKTSTNNRPALLPSEHAIALADQAHAMRRASTRLTRLAVEMTHEPTGPMGEKLRLAAIRKELRLIRHNLVALNARFGEE